MGIRKKRGHDPRAAATRAMGTQDYSPPKVVQPTTWTLPYDLDRLPTQREFVADLLHPCQVYGGGVGNGKTAGGIAKAFLLSQIFPGSTGMIARWEGKELRQTTMAEFRKIIPKQIIERSNDQIGELTFKRAYGGSTIYYRDLKDADLNNYNLTWAYVDQCEEIDGDRWDALERRTRQQTPLMLDDGPAKDPHTGKVLYAPNFVFGTFNPEGTNSYLWRYFHPDSPEYRAGYHLYMATTFDGLKAGFISQQYVDKLLAAYSEQARKRYLEGAWDVFSGRIYPQFEQTVHVIPTIDPQPHWRIYETIDHGLINPTAALWVAVDEHDNWYVLDEHYEGNGKPVQYHAAIIRNKRGQFPKWTGISYLDSACWGQTQSHDNLVYSVADEYAKYGVSCVAGTKDWPMAYSRITARLQLDPEHRHPLTGRLGAPKLYVAESCIHTINEFLCYTWKKNRGVILRNTPDEPIDRDDHAMDALAYLAASVQGGPPPPPLLNELTALERWQKMRCAYNPLADAPAIAGSWMGR